jgi:hypothetical protein
MTTPRNRRSTAFYADGLHFYLGVLTDERSDAEAESDRTPAGPQPGMDVLDLACGHGRIVNRWPKRERRDRADASLSFRFGSRARGRGGVSTMYAETCAACRGRLSSTGS